MSPRLLLLEDTHEVVQVVAQTARLVWPESTLTVVHDGQQALRAAEEDVFTLALIDVDICSPAGQALCRQIRTLVAGDLLIIGAENTPQERITAFELGADQYLAKPFDENELRARLQALARRLAGEHDRQSARIETSTRVQGRERIVLLEAAHEAWIDGRRIHLTPTEFRLLRELIDHTGQTVAHCELLRRVWGTVYQEEVEYLKVFVQRLRRKLGDPAWIQTDRGAGYRFVRLDTVGDAHGEIS